MNLAARCEYWARWLPDEVALRAEGTDVTWAELGERVARVAGGLAERGVEIGDRVGILGHNSVEWCVVALAAMLRGGTVVPLNVRLAPPELASIVEHAGCRAVAYDEGLFELFDKASDKLATVPLRISLDGRTEAEVTVAELGEADPMRSVGRDGDDPAVIGYTSGTTGLPKGAILTHANVAACALHTALAESSGYERRTLLNIPLAFTGGVINNFLATFAVGGTLVIERKFDPDRAIEVLERERITTWFAVPIMWQSVADTDGFADADLSALKTAMCGGAPVSSELLQAYHEKDVQIRQAYGLTEACASVCLLPAELAFSHRTAAGLPNVDTRVRLLDDDGEPVPDGEVGEIVVQGPQVMAGYWEDEKATAETLRDGWLYTGDLARWNDGLLEVVDRKKSMFISGGLNVYPAEVERVVEALPEVAECAAFGLEHERWGEACAVVVVASQEGIDEDALVAHCREQLADYKVPRTVFQSDEPLPRGMSGKILRPEISRKYGQVEPATSS